MCNSNSYIARYSDDFAEVRSEIAYRLRNKISSLLRSLAKKTSGMLSGKVSKWLLQCASEVSRGKIEKAKIILTRTTIFIKNNKEILGVSALAALSAIGAIGVLLHNKALLQKKMKEGLIGIVQKARLHFAMRNKEEGRPSKREFVSSLLNGKQLGGTTKTALSKKIESAVESINKEKLVVLNIIRIAEDQNTPKSKLEKLKRRLENPVQNKLLIGGNKFEGAAGSVLRKILLKKQSELSSLYHKANVLLSKRTKDSLYGR